jgi:hypothetical protein
MISANRATG